MIGEADDLLAAGTTAPSTSVGFAAASDRVGTFGSEAGDGSEGRGSEGVGMLMPR
jgi:hypothetical protein